MSVRKITKEYFDDVKHTIKWSTAKRAAKIHGISLKTALQIKGSKDYQEYRDQCKAQHPDTKFSLAEQVFETHKIVFDKGDNKYIAPLTARTAILELQIKLIPNEPKRTLNA